MQAETLTARDNLISSWSIVCGACSVRIKLHFQLAYGGPVLMPFQSPNLDDRDFNHWLKREASHRARCPQWTDLSPGDPGIVLLEVFAYLTETMIYRLNRLPEKALYRIPSADRRQLNRRPRRLCR